MIARTLVPAGARLSAVERQDGARSSTRLDARTLVPADAPLTPLDTTSRIPAHVPLEVLGNRLLVPREAAASPRQLEIATDAASAKTPLDSRVVVPGGAAPAALELKPLERVPDLVEPDLITTGDVHLLNRPIEERRSGWTRHAGLSSAVFHAAVIVLILLQPKMFPYVPPSVEEIELARRQLAPLGYIYLPPETRDVPRVPPPPNQQSSPQVRIDPRTLRQLAPTEPEPQDKPGAKGPENLLAQRDLPAAPTESARSTDSEEPTSRREAPPKLRLEAPKDTSSGPPLDLGPSRVSPGRQLEQSMRGALRGGPVPQGGFSQPQPLGGGGGGGAGYVAEGLQLLTPTEGVDFTNYLARVLASVRRNWYAVIPESARLGERGRVIIEFRILKDGNVPYPEPFLVAGSGRDPLDRAAMSSIRTSNPFEPLPPAFSGPHIALRFTFLYNMRPEEL